MKCENGNHEYLPGAEVCNCGAEQKHMRCQCDKCGQVHWLPRKVGLQPEDGFKITTEGAMVHSLPLPESELSETTNTLGRLGSV